MILYKTFINKYEVSYFMKFLIFLSMFITCSNAGKLLSSQKRPPQSNSNETLSDLDFEDSVNPILLSEHYSLPNLLQKSHLIENELKFQSSTFPSINDQKKSKKFLQSKKHRNIIKMVCDSDNLISQMTLHMNFLDNSKDEKHRDFTFKKIFNSDDTSNEVSFSYPEGPDAFSGSKLDETGEKPVKDIELSVLKQHHEKDSLKKDNNINYILLNDEYETYPVAKKKKVKAQTYGKDDYKAEIKKYNSGPRVESLKSLRENYAPNLVKEKKKNNKVKFRVTAASFTDTSEYVEKNNQLHKLHLPESSNHLDPLPLNSNTPESEESSPDPGLDSNDGIISQVVDNIEEAQNNTENDQDNSFSDREYDGENKNNEEVLNYSKKFKKYKIANSKHAIDENENIDQSDDALLYDYPQSYKRRYHNKIVNKNNDQVDKEKAKKKYKAWKNSLITQPKMKSIVSLNRAQLFGGKNSVAFADKKKKTLQRQKVIENLKFILSKQGNEHPKKESNSPQAKYFSKEKTKDTTKMLNFSKTFEKNNNTKVVNISENQTNNVLFQTDDKEIESSSAMEEILFAYENQNIPFDIYDIDINDNNGKTKLSDKEIFHQTSNEKNKKYDNQKDLKSKFNTPFKKESVLTNTYDKDKQFSQDANQHEKYLVKRMADDRGEEIRKGVFLKKGIPLQFDPIHKISVFGNEQFLGFQNMSPIAGSMRQLSHGNEKQNINPGKNFKSKEQNSHFNSNNLEIHIKRDTMSDSKYQRACRRFLRDIALIKFLDDKFISESILYYN